MNKLFTIISLVIVSLWAFAAQAVDTENLPTSKTMTQEVIDACTNQDEGDDCDFTQNDVRKGGICKPDANGKLICVDKP